MVVTTYNKHMGGVDLLDSLISLYRTHLWSKKWYFRIFLHLLDLTIVNAWQLYKQTAASNTDEPDRKCLALADFKMEVAKSLFKAEKTEDRKRGRPSKETVEIAMQKKTGGGGWGANSTMPSYRRQNRWSGALSLPEWKTAEMQISSLHRNLHDKFLEVQSPPLFNTKKELLLYVPHKSVRACFCVDFELQEISCTNIEYACHNWILCACCCMDATLLFSAIFSLQAHNSILNGITTFSL